MPNHVKAYGSDADAEWTLVRPVGIAECRQRAYEGDRGNDEITDRAMEHRTRHRRRSAITPKRVERKLCNLPQQVPAGHRDKVASDRGEPTRLRNHGVPVIGRPADGGPPKRGNQPGVAAA